MQVLILYYSKGGNTRQLAEEIAKGVESVSGVQALIKSTQEVSKNDFTDSAGIIAGSPVYFGIMAADLKRVFDEFIGVRKKMENKVGAAFATSGDPTGGKRPPCYPLSNVFLSTAWWLSEILLMQQDMMEQPA